MTTPMLARITLPQVKRITTALQDLGVRCYSPTVNVRFGTIQIPDAKRVVRVDVFGTVWLYDPTQGTPNHRTPLLKDHVNIRSPRWTKDTAALVHGWLSGTTTETDVARPDASDTTPLAKATPKPYSVPKLDLDTRRRIYDLWATGAAPKDIAAPLGITYRDKPDTNIIRRTIVGGHKKAGKWERLYKDDDHLRRQALLTRDLLHIPDDSAASTLRQWFDGTLMHPH